MKVLITGTSHGIGRGIAQKFMDMGHEVIGFDREPPAPEQATNRCFTYYKVDIGNLAELPELDGIEILVNNAGSLIDEEAIRCKLMGYYYVTEKYAFQPRIRSVLNISSQSAYQGIESPLYSMCNGAVISYAKNLARRLAQYGATANSVSPGFVKSDIEPWIYENGLDEKITDLYLIKKETEPYEIGELVYYLTVINKSITGQDVLVDCGESIGNEYVDVPENIEKFYRSALVKRSTTQPLKITGIEGI